MKQRCSKCNCLTLKVYYRAEQLIAVQPHVAFDKNWCGRGLDYVI